MKYKLKYEKDIKNNIESINDENTLSHEIITNNINSNIYGQVYFNQYISQGGSSSNRKYNNILFKNEISKKIKKENIELKNNSYSSSRNDDGCTLMSIKQRAHQVLETYYNTIIKK
jgi:hypothetical protein